ncbi:MAG: hypothetical protein ACTH5K_06235, partial [Pseudolactococcus laudensis]
FMQKNRLGNFPTRFIIEPIFVMTLEAYDYIVKHEEESYRFNLTFDEREFETVVFKDAHDFIAAQIRQCEAVPSFVKLGV